MRTLTLLLFFAATFSCYGQTKTETCDYLETYYEKIPDQNGWGQSMQLNCEDGVISFIECMSWINEEGRCEEKNHFKIEMSQVQGVSYEYQKYEKTSANGYRPECWVLRIKTSAQKHEIWINSNKEKSYVEKFKKALLKMAELNGAKIVKEDLFD